MTGVKLALPSYNVASAIMCLGGNRTDFVNIIGHVKLKPRVCKISKKT